MIPYTELICHEKVKRKTWQQALASAICDPRELLACLELDSTDLSQKYLAAADFPLRVPRSFVDRMKKGDWQDPLLLQVLPHGKELTSPLGFTQDPLQEARCSPQSGLIHKYHGRVLLMISGSCAINCRYCFRRHFPYQDHQQGRREWRRTLDYIMADTGISEVIFSGGDPLLASDTWLAARVRALAEVPHVTRLRIHTRLPIVIPERVTSALVAGLTATRLKPVVVVHCNHANELSEDVFAALQLLRAAGVVLLNQSVLLAGVNDTVDALCALSEALFRGGVLPYYLHLLDRVQGASHFEVDENRATLLSCQMMDRLPGYLVPKVVREVPGRGSKMHVKITEKQTAQGVF